MRHTATPDPVMTVSRPSCWSNSTMRSPRSRHGRPGVTSRSAEEPDRASPMPDDSALADDINSHLATSEVGEVFPEPSVNGECYSEESDTPPAHGVSGSGVWGPFS